MSVIFFCLLVRFLCIGSRRFAAVFQFRAETFQVRAAARQADLQQPASATELLRLHHPAAAEKPRVPGRWQAGHPQQVMSLSDHII